MTFNNHFGAILISRQSFCFAWDRVEIYYKK